MTPFNAAQTTVEGIRLITNRTNREGFAHFQELFHVKQMQEAGLPIIWDFEALLETQVGCLNGLHVDRVSHKLFKCILGGVFAVWVDLRPESPTFKKWEAVNLESSAESVLIPPGVAFGFLVLTEFAVLNYRTTVLYDKKNDRGVLWNDPTLGIDWPLEEGQLPSLSAKDAQLPTLSDYLAGLETQQSK